MADLILGSQLDEQTGQRADTPAVVATDDLVTHGVIVGMTGSGKTGLGAVLIEECLSAGVPTLLFDPKGDLTNLCLIFSELTGDAFVPWVDPGAASRAGRSVSEYAADQAELWRNGLASWQITPERLATLRRDVEFTVYTPGSSAGVPLNILGSLAAPADGADDETLQDEIAGYTTSLLNLLGIDADPLTSREHILLSTIIDRSWKAGQSLDLAGLIASITTPPFRKVGVFDLEHFFPAAQRTDFALRLNGLLAAPGFAAWMQGDPVDVEKLLRTPDGRPRCTVITLAHLSDTERQSVTALVLSKVVTWMRAQTGTTDLRALVYLDEIAGYVPPVSNPPTKAPLLLLMKQARAFGVGVVLSTQNPVDVDYKALSNAGTWIIGRLQTEQDKARLLDGLTSAVGGNDQSRLQQTISALDKRQFVLRQAGAGEPALITSRWAMSYLRGPLTRDQIAALKQVSFLSPAGTVADPPPSPVEQQAPLPALHADETPVPPPVASRVPVAYLDPAAPWAAQVGVGPGARLTAMAVARVHLVYDERRADLVHDEEYEAVLPSLPTGADLRGLVSVDYDDRDLVDSAPANARYVLPEADIASSTWWTGLSRALVDHLVRERPLEVLVNRELSLYSRPGEAREQFEQRCRDAADEAADAAIVKLRDKAESRVRTLQSRLNSAHDQAVRAEERRNAQISTDVATTVGSLLGGVLGGRRSRSSVAAAARRAQAAADRVTNARAKVDDLTEQIALLEADLADEIAEIDDEWAQKAELIESVPVPLERSDVSVRDLRLVWAGRRDT
jgi:hypothetical protein